jgi:hypothetical protein
LLKVRVRLAAPDGAHEPAVAIDFVPDDEHVLAEDQGGEMTFRDLAECLAAFGRVDAVEADRVLEMMVVEDGERVAVGDTHYPAVEIVGRERHGRSHREPEQRAYGREATHAAIIRPGRLLIAGDTPAPSSLRRSGRRLRWTTARP